MLPCQSTNYGTDILFGNAKLARDIFVSSFLCRLATNRAYRVLSKFGFAAILAYWTVASSFVAAIYHVLGTSTQKEVIGVAARRIVAFMANFHIPWGVPCGKFICDTIGLVIFAVELKSSVAAFCPAVFPLPAFIRAALVNLFPKAFSDRAQPTSLAVMARDESCGLALNMPVTTAGLFCNRGRVAASASAKFDALYGIIGVHKKPTFLCQAQDVCPSLGTFYWGASRVSIPQMGGFGI